MNLKLPTSRSFLCRVSAGLALVGLAFVVWSVLDPSPIPVIAAMSIGQGFGILSLGVFTAAVVVDLVRQRRRHPDTGEPIEVSGVHAAQKEDPA